MNDYPAIRWVVALKPEARIIRKNFNMSSSTQNSPYPLFKNASGQHWLTISGVGRINAAAATIYLYQISKAPPWTIWINVGIAGSGGSPIGSLYLIDKITDFSTQLSVFPKPALSVSIPRSSLLTLDAPGENYSRDQLFDMEGYSFFEIASKLSCQQLILVLKIVSDGPDINFRSIMSKNVSELVARHIEVLSNVVDDLASVSKIEYDRLHIPDAYNSIVTKYHFTETQKHQLKKLIIRWRALFPERKPVDEIVNTNNASMALKALRAGIDSYKIKWDKK
tara:strand:+ start:812 stop:1651 length:840 start_codon:yes stop_codon:yes gene_type:complete